MKINFALALLGLTLASDEEKVLFVENLGKDQWFVPGAWSYKYEPVEDDPSLNSLFNELKADL